MIVPFSAADFLDRALAVYRDRIGVFDEPDQPAASLGDADLRAARRARPARMAAELDALGIGVGERVAIVSPQQRPAAHARSSASAATAGCWCRSTSGCRPRRSPTSSSTAARGCCYVDPELDESLADVEVRAQFVLGDGRRPVRCRGRRAAAVGARRGRDRDDQLHVRHDRPAQGRADHPPQHLGQRGDVRAARRGHRPRRLPAHAADVPRQRLGDAVRDDRARRAAGGAAQGRRRRDPAPGRAARRHGDVRGARGRRTRSSRPRRTGTGAIPGRDRVRIIVAGAPPPTQDDRAGRGRARLGVHPDLRPDRDLAAAHDQPDAARSGTSCRRRSGPRKLVRAGSPALGVR